MQGLRILTLLLVLILILTLQLSGDSKAAIDHNNAGITLAKEGRWEKTWTELGEARRLDTQAADTYYRRGLAHADLGQHQKALEDYDEALRNDPNYAFAYNTAIARELKLAQNTVETYINAIYQELGASREPGVHSRVSATLIYLRESNLLV